MSIIRYQPTELSLWSPFDRLSTLREQMNRLFDLSLPEATHDGGLFGGWTPPLDIYQDKDNVFVKAELPGLKKEEIEISLHDGVLSIGGERKHEEESKKGESFRSERFFGRFQRSVTLPTPVDASKVTATYKDGILAVTLPKSEEAKPKQIQVNVS
jgi:HSP20 family protein